MGGGVGAVTSFSVPLWPVAVQPVLREGGEFCAGRFVAAVWAGFALRGDPVHAPIVEPHGQVCTIGAKGDVAAVRIDVVPRPQQPSVAAVEIDDQQQGGGGLFFVTPVGEPGQPLTIRRPGDVDGAIGVRHDLAVTSAVGPGHRQCTGVVVGNLLAVRRPGRDQRVVVFTLAGESHNGPIVQIGHV